MALFFNRRLQELGIPHVLVPWKEETDVVVVKRIFKSPRIRRAPPPPRQKAIKMKSVDLRKCREKTFVPHYNAEVQHRYYMKHKDDPDWVKTKKELYEKTKDRYREQRMEASRKWYAEKKKDPQWLAAKADKQRIYEAKKKL